MTICTLAFLPRVLGGQEPPRDSPRNQMLRQRIIERFSERVRQDLGLDDAQSDRMMTTVRTWFQKRRDLETQERGLRDQLAAQLRPGVAANQDSVVRLTNGILQLKQRYAETFRDEMQDLSAFLTPVQRAQYLLLRERLFDMIRDAWERRRGGAGYDQP